MDENNKPDQVVEGATPQEDEPILDLTEEVPDEPEGAEGSIPSDEAAVEPSAEDESGFDAVVEDPLAATVELEEGFDEDLGIDDDEDDFVGSMGMEIGGDEEDEDVSDFEETADIAPAEGVDVSEEQLDAALERVIKNMFYDKIDRVLVDVIEKTVKNEIERLKSLLLEEASGDDK